MNFGDIKPVGGDKSPASLANKDSKAKLQEEGLRQAARFQETQVSLSTSQSKSEIGIRILSASLNQTVVIGQSKPNIEPPSKKKDSAFDFEEVAKNVLSFVGGVIKAAKQGGADDENLNGMFEQATSGVLKGVEMARKDLTGFMNDEIDNGINKSLELIQDGIEKLRGEVFGNVSEDENITELNASYTRESSASVEIFTKDGDKVTIGFGAFQSLELNQQLLSSSEVPVRERQDKEEAAQEEGSNNDDSASSKGGNESFSYYERRGLSFSIEGDLDEDEKTAIADFLGDVKGLTDSFFKGDIEGAFNKALDLGFNDQELTGYALQLSKVEQVQVIQTYGAVSQYKDSQNERESINPAKQIKPIADYLKEMMSVLEKSSDVLQDKSQYEKLLPGLLNEVLDVSTGELLEAVNQFNNFNNRLVRNLPEEIDGSTLNDESGIDAG
ncbi:DUF5610 domain-containing protein [Alteromonas sp. a30]|uniref:DUF5610 domain-containing protein n=1 Tax=Alteromonas sp. a30 TaxID=2730917 RepID=UPI002282F1A7|nr:DUF5610 domain-containing protein [Alteromonas sp. a30]MCY7296559.1 DUF5610 domain-containing protein [Alteromonas sp. a30]